MKNYSAYIGEALIPLLGFYYWNWSWYFILLFYILDAMAKVVVLHLKSNKILQTQGGETARFVWKRSGSITAAVDLVVVTLLHVMYMLNHPDFQLGKEIIAFLSHKEMGLAQGWFLIPVIVLGVWLQYQFTFLKLKMHTKTQMSVLWKEHLQFRSVVLGTVVLGSIIHYFFSLNDAVFVWGSVLLPFLSTYIFSRFR